MGALVIPTYAAIMLNLGSNLNSNTNLFLTLAIKMLFFAVISGIASIISAYLCSDLTQKVGADMRKLFILNH